MSTNTPWAPQAPQPVQLRGLPRTHLYRTQRQAKKIRAQADTYSPLTREELTDQYHRLRHASQEIITYSGGITHLRKTRTKKKLSPLINQALALGLHAAERATGLRAHPNQVAAATLLGHGSLVELATGEGKTLVGLIAAPALALLGPVHIITANKYLAGRDAAYAAPALALLGLTADAALASQAEDRNRSAYHADLTYSTAQQVGFDLLRDSLSNFETEPIQRPPAAVLIDEADAILVDEARTPLIIAGTSPIKHSEWVAVAKAVDSLDPALDVLVDIKEEGVSLTDTGLERVSTALRVEDIHNHPRLFYMLDATLRAFFILEKDKDYVITTLEGATKPQVISIDANTGRMLPDRRFVDGIHEALEAKEGIDPTLASRALAQITIQALFSTYPHLCGMSGTLFSAKSELASAFRVDVVEVSSHFPSQRTDAPDLIFRRKAYKHQALVEQVRTHLANSRPVLVGTTSVAESEEISSLFTAAGLNHELLNAHQHAHEAAIIAQAGRPRALTVATNMAGRGVDILLGGNPDLLTKQELEQVCKTAEESGVHLSSGQIEIVKSEILARWQEQCAHDRERVIAAGGLAVIGSSRNTSGRIDNQLRGRAGRQGEPGSAQFYLSAEDELLQIYGGPKIGLLVTRFARGVTGVPVTSRVLTKATQRAQRTLENKDANVRATLRKFDGVIAAQRHAVAQWRKAVTTAESEQLISTHIYPAFLSLLQRSAGETSWTHLDFTTPWGEAELAALKILQRELPLLLPREHWSEHYNPIAHFPALPDVLLRNNSATELAAEFTEIFTKSLLGRWSWVEAEITQGVLRQAILHHIDQAWSWQSSTLSHLIDVVSIRRSTSAVAEFTKEATDAWEEFRTDVAFRLGHTLSRMQIKSVGDQQAPTSPPSTTPTLMEEMSK